LSPYSLFSLLLRLTLKVVKGYDHLALFFRKALATNVCVTLMIFSLHQLDFILEYRGRCFNRRQDGRGECELKAQSEEFVTRIRGDGKVHLEVNPLIGSISLMRVREIRSSRYLTFFSQLTDQLFGNHSYTARGNVTFGVHQTHENHKLHFQTLGVGRETTVKDPREMIGIATILDVVAGEGALKGDRVIISYRYEI